MPDSSYHVAAESVAISATQPGNVTACSQSVGWTDLLVSTLEDAANTEPFEIAASPDQRIVLMKRGHCRIESFSSGAWQAAEYRPGMGGMTASGRASRLRWQALGHETCETVHIFIPQQLVAMTIDEYQRSRTGFRSAPLDTLCFDDPLVAQISLALVAAIKSGAANLYAQSAAQMLTTHLLAQHSRWPDTSTDDRSPGVISHRRLRRVLTYMEAHYGESSSLDKLAREAGVSRFHFAHLFRTQVGMTPHRYLVQLRMEAAAKLLHET